MYTLADMEYNTGRNMLIMREYGRHIQKMIEYLLTLEDKEERQRNAYAVIELMGFLNPHLRDVADFKHKLWDHLHIISNFQIDVDSPYPPPNPETIHLKPEPLKYPHQRIKYKHYGKTIEMMINKAKTIEEPERRNHMVQAIANFMKMANVQWNKDSVADETIFAHLRELSNGELKLDETVNLNKVEYRSNNTHKTENTGRGRNQNNQNNQNRGRTNNNQNNKNNQNNRNRNSGGGSGGGGRKY